MRADAKPKCNRKGKEQSAVSIQPLNILFHLKCFANRNILCFTAEGAENAEEEKSMKSIVQSTFTHLPIYSFTHSVQGLNAEC